MSKYLVANSKSPNFALEYMSKFVYSINSPKVWTTRFRNRQGLINGKHVLVVQKSTLEFIAMYVCLFDGSVTNTNVEVVLLAPGN
jgi:hypothetical protein